MRLDKIATAVRCTEVVSRLAVGYSDKQEPTRLRRSKEAEGNP